MMRFQVVLLLAVVLTAISALAQPERFQQKLTRLTSELSLTDDQKSQLQKIHEEYMKAMPEKKKAMLEARNQLQTALRGTASDSECQKRFEGLEKRQTEFGRARFQKLLAVRSVLTPEQRQKFKSDDEKAE